MTTPSTPTAIFGAGCFLGVQARFELEPGVVSTEVGYAGGDTPEPSYEQVCSKRTGHAEVVKVVFDPAKTSFEKLLDVFWHIHDPTQLNRQGPDVGSQYRSAIMPTTDEQKTIAERAKAALGEGTGTLGGREVVTTIEPGAAYYPAEDYHQHYLAKRGVDSCGGSCAV